MRKHVLVVEDEPDVGYLLRLVIEQGHTVTLAASVTEARLRGCGANAVVGKPFEPDHLQRLIDRLVQAA
jgi:CheY-like chemotaxis protein